MKGKTIEYYDEHALTLNSRYVKADVAQLQSELLHYLEPCGHVLELGSGSGREAVLFLRQGMAYTGIDGSAELSRLAVENHPQLAGKIRVHDLSEGLPEFPFRFDGVFSLATLMHFDRDELDRLLSQLHACLLPGARGFISVSDASDQRKEDPRYFNELGKTDWEELFTRHGFRIIEGKERTDALGRDISWFTFYLEHDGH